MRAFLLALILTSPAFAEPIPGADDPAFRAPFERALHSDDPTALTDLHAAAQAGNTAALLALPAANDWLRATLPFSERKLLGHINGIPLAEAYTAADPTAALWALGDPGTDMDALLQRAFALYDANEPDKATYLFMTWVNQTGGYNQLPSGFWDHPLPPWAMAQVLRGRLIDNGITEPAEGDALVVDRLMSDDPAAWITLAAFADRAPETNAKAHFDRLYAMITKTGLTKVEAERRMAEVLPALRAIQRVDPILAPATAEAAAAIFRTEPGFQPLLTLCATACPQTKDQCTTAFVAAFGHPYGRVTLSQPLTSLISTEDFFASPRGRLILLRSTRGALGDDSATSSALAAARQIDACLADAILAAIP